MARLISVAIGNFVDASTWGLVDSTSALDAETGNEIVTTAYSGTRSQTFTPGAITIDGMAVKIASRAASPTGTISIDLAIAGVGVAGTEVTLNVSDLPLCDTTDNNGGWVFFKFATPVLLVVATAYAIEAKTSSSSQVNLFRDGTGDNISRLLRTTTTQAPTTGDDMYIMGEHTGAGTGNNLTVTMNETAATDYGSANTSPTVPGLSVSKRGTLTCGSAGSTNYLLRLSGHFIVYSNGTFNWGTSGTPIPSTSTAIFELDPPADGNFGFWFRSLSTVSIYGNAISFVKTLLNADASSSATSLTSADTTGWKNGDVLGIASTTRTYSESETKTLSGDASGTTITISAGLTNAHKGSGSTKAEIVNLTRNVRFRSTSSSLMTYMIAQKTAAVTMRYAEMYYMGDDSTDPANGANSIANFQLGGTTGAQDVQYCSFHDFEDTFARIGSATATSVIFSNNVIYNVGTTTPTTNQGVHLDAPATTTQNGITISGNVIILAVSNASSLGTNALCRIQSSKVIFTNNTFAGCSAGASIPIFQLYDGTFFAVNGNFDSLTVHSCNGSHGISLLGGTSNAWLAGFFSNITCWRNNMVGMDLGRGSSLISSPLILDGGTFFGNTTSNIQFDAAINAELVFRNYTVDADASFATTNGLNTNSNLCKHITLIKCLFGTNTAHTTDITTATTIPFYIDAINCSFASATEVSNVQSGLEGSYFRSQKHDGSLDNTFSKYRRGTILAEVTNRNTPSGYAWKLTPTSAISKLIYPGPIFTDTLKAAVAASSLVTVTIKAVKNAAYNGNAARLVLVGGIVSGIASDVTASKTETQKTITAATNATPIVITSAAHGYSNGDVVLIEGIVGNTAGNGIWVVANKATDTFELTGSIGNGVYSSGGTSNKYETLTVTGTPTDNGVIEFYVDCDGTAGSIYIDDVSVTQ